MTNIITTGNEGDVYFTPYKSYVALLTQDGTAAPIATVMNANDSNFLSGIVWTRYAQGIYHATLTGQFIQGKTFYSITQNRDPSGNSMFFSINQAAYPDYIGIETYYLNGTNWLSIDGQLFDTPIEIRVYP